MRPKYGASVDQNQKPIADALRAIGCEVWEIGRPCDLLVGHEGTNYLIEVKREGTKPRKDQQDQWDWMEQWPGQVDVCKTPDEAIALVTGVNHD